MDQKSDSMDDNSIIRLATFTTICKILKFVSSNKIIDLPIVYYDPSDKYLDIFVQYIHSNLQPLMNDRNDETDGEKTVNNLSFLLNSTHLDSVSSSVI